jgi:DNA-binding NtrC family response regulator
MTAPTDLLPGDDSTQETLELGTSGVRGPWMIELGSAQGVRCVTLEPGAELVMGSARSADVRLYDRAVSARHFRLRAHASGLIAEDLGSKNGLFVGGAVVRAALLNGPHSHFVAGRTTVTIVARAEQEPLDTDAPLPDVVGSSAPMRRVAREVRRYARLRAPVLLQGESGTGKDLIARALHRLSRRSGAYVPINAGAMPESLADAELFGHCRGAFTGAVATRVGAFQQADQGTLFLDEIAELAPSVQVKLLRVVEDGNVRPVGATRTTSVDVRIVAATWMPLAERAAEGRFRADLYHRIALVVIELPPLRQRKSDIPALSSTALAEIEPEVGPKRLTGAALARLVAHHWPGNVRELRAVLYRAAVTASRAIIDSEHVELGSVERRAPVRPSPEHARKLVENHRGNISAAARAAGVARSTFRAWLERSD